MEVLLFLTEVLQTQDKKIKLYVKGLLFTVFTFVFVLRVGIFHGLLNPMLIVINIFVPLMYLFLLCNLVASAT